ncbi:MAG: hypothetical protein IT270_12595 [Saprospiraceae bacterium]|nr:hypothetical protein [Saprospiraceae bacterium]
MKKALKILGYFLLALLVIVACFAAYIQVAPFPTYEAKMPVFVVASDSAHIAEGRRIVLTKCGYCHRSPEGTLSGDLWGDDPMFGKIWAANLTHHPTAGIGNYTGGELAYLLRTGIKKDGKFAGPFMMFPTMTDEDLASVIAFLKSDAPEVQPSDWQKPPAQLTFLAKMWLKVLVKPSEYSDKPIVTPSPADSIAYGKYLTTSKWECSLCHSESFETYNHFEPEKSPGYLGGGNLVGKKNEKPVPSANLTPDKETGLGNWTLEQFSDAVRYGKRPDGRAMNHAMPPFAVLTDAEVSAIWQYLKTTPPLKNKVVQAENQ